MIANAIRIGAVVAAATFVPTAIVGATTYGCIKLGNVAVSAIEAHCEKKRAQQRETEEIERQTGLEIVSWQ